MAKPTPEGKRVAAEQSKTGADAAKTAPGAIAEGRGFRIPISGFRPGLAGDAPHSPAIVTKTSDKTTDCFNLKCQLKPAAIVGCYLSCGQ